MESIHDYVLKCLQDEKGNWPRVAREAGVSYRTLKKIATRDTVSPGIVNLEKLAEYFRNVTAA